MQFHFTHVILPSFYNYVLYIFILCMECELLWDFALCSGLVELIVTVQA
jgi:hypothetical protein